MKKCKVCEKKFSETGMFPLVKKGVSCYSDSDDLSQKFICKRCLAISDDYGKCSLCFEDVVYHMKDLRWSDGSQYCKEHISEVQMDEEELEDWEDYIDYINKD